jgi:hypothetical protein
MRRIPIDQVKPGTVLAKEITNAKGLPLMAPGTVLTDALIARLDRIGVTAVYVEGEPIEGGKAVKTLAELDRELDQRFRKVTADPVQVLIREAIRRHLHARYGEAVQAREGANP